MPAPYRQGDTAVHLDDVPEGIKVSRTSVLYVAEEDELGKWLVVTELGDYLVDAAGQGGRLWPSDEELDKQLAEQGDGFVVGPEPPGADIPELDQALDQALDDLWATAQAAEEQGPEPTRGPDVPDRAQDRDLSDRDPGRDGPSGGFDR